MQISMTLEPEKDIFSRLKIHAENNTSWACWYKDSVICNSDNEEDFKESVGIEEIVYILRDGFNYNHLVTKDKVIHVQKPDDVAFLVTRYDSMMKHILPEEFIHKEIIEYFVKNINKRNISDITDIVYLRYVFRNNKKLLKSYKTNNSVQLIMMLNNFKNYYKYVNKKSWDCLDDCNWVFALSLHPSLVKFYNNGDLSTMDAASKILLVCTNPEFQKYIEDYVEPQSFFKRLWLIFFPKKVEIDEEMQEYLNACAYSKPKINE